MQTLHSIRQIEANQAFMELKVCLPLRTSPEADIPP
jgi:hypothetical protein